MRTGLHWVLVGFRWAGAATVLLVLAYIGYCVVTLPASGGGNADETGPAIVFTAAGGQVFAARGAGRADKVEIDRLPADLVHAVIAIEDRRFYSHHGIDLRGILRAAWHDLRGEGGLEGASTITQQLARMSYLSPERSLRRKVQEIIIALWLETRLSKDQILARYLNSAYFGAGAYGVDAAAQRYFGKKAGSLNLAESAMLAGLIRSPTQLAPTQNLEAARRRADTVLEAMVAAGDLDKARAAAARAHPAKLAAPPETEPGQNYSRDARVLWERKRRQAARLAALPRHRLVPVTDLRRQCGKGQSRSFSLPIAQSRARPFGSTIRKKTISAPKIIDCRLVTRLTGTSSPARRGALSRKIGNSTMKAAPRKEPRMLPRPPMMTMNRIWNERSISKALASTALV